MVKCDFSFWTRILVILFKKNIYYYSFVGGQSTELGSNPITRHVFFVSIISDNKDNKITIDISVISYGHGPWS